MSAVPFWVYIVFAIIFNSFGEYFSKIWGNTQNILYAILTVLVYSISNVCWLGLMSHKNSLVLLSMLWVIVVAILSIIVGVGFFNETLSVRQWIGIAISMVAIFLLCE